jgi:hypothetical protein
MSIIERETTGLERVEAVAGEIREFMRSDAAGLRQPPENDGKIVADNIGSLIQRVSGSSVQEIDRLISDLQILRERLHDEGERVRREIVEYATMSQAAVQWTKIIAGSLRHRKRPDAPSIDEGASGVGGDASRFELGFPMPSYKFRVGETVTMSPATSRNVPGGAYVVTMRLPDNGAEPEYRIRSTNEPYERVARESELTRA